MAPPPAPAKPVPKPTPETAPFWVGCREGELRLQRCRDCDRIQFPPRRFCAGCLSDHIDWERASGRGSVRTYTVVTMPASAAFVEDLPYVVALVELAEGPTLVAGIKGCAPEDLRIGLPVEVEFEARSDEIHVPYFHPATS